MSLFNVLMIITLLTSTAITALTVDRVFAYNRKYRFPENEYTMLFGFIRKRHIILVYLAFVAIQTLFGIWFIATL